MPKQFAALSLFIGNCQRKAERDPGLPMYQRGADAISTLRRPTTGSRTSPLSASVYDLTALARGP